jgi:hypothetical protein
MKAETVKELEKFLIWLLELDEKELRLICNKQGNIDVDKTIKVYQNPKPTKQI